MTNNEKLKLINTLKILDSSSSLGEIEYVLIENNQINRNILNKIGYSDTDIEELCSPEDNTLDISMIGFTFAKYFNMKENIFFNEVWEEY